MPMVVFLYHFIFHHGAVPCLDNIVKLRVDRGLNQHLVAIIAEQLDNGGQGRHNAETPAHQGSIGLPVVAAHFPVLHSLKIAVRAGGVAPNAFLGLCLAGVNNGLCRAKVHIRNPQRNHIGRSEFLDALVIL